MILIVCRLHICKFTYLLKVIHNAPSILALLSWPFVDRHTVATNLSCSMCTFPAKVNRSDPAFLFQLRLEMCPFHGTFSTIFSCFLLVISLFKIAPKRSAEVLSIPKHKKAVMSIKEEGCVSDKPWLGTMYCPWVQCQWTNYIY